ncbi:MAG: NYN domain-containing protein [Candidatus Aminicenantia bacterium]
MAYLIDGNNLIGHTPNLELNNRESRYRLILRLFRFQRLKKSKVTIVFDGQPDANLAQLNFSRKKFNIIFSDITFSADSKIKEIISAKKYLKDLHVVSSDRELTNFVKSKGARVIKCSEFNKQIKKLFKEENERRKDWKEEKDLSPLEVKHWLEIFKQKDD